MPIFSKRNKNGNLSINLMATDGLPQFPRGLAVRLTFDAANSRLCIEPRIGKNPPLFLSCNEITAIQEISSTEILEKSKSVIGRAAIGGILLGPLGAIVGGASGIGEKQKSIVKDFLVINYHPINNQEETKAISFEIVGATLHLNSFVDAVKQQIIPEGEFQVSQNL